MRGGGEGYSYLFVCFCCFCEWTWSLPSSTILYYYDSAALIPCASTLDISVLSAAFGTGGWSSASPSLLLKRRERGKGQDTKPYYSTNALFSELAMDLFISFILLLYILSPSHLAIE